MQVIEEVKYSWSDGALVVNLPRSFLLSDDPDVLVAAFLQELEKAGPTSEDRPRLVVVKLPDDDGGIASAEAGFLLRLQRLSKKSNVLLTCDPSPRIMEYIVALNLGVLLHGPPPSESPTSVKSTTEQGRSSVTARNLLEWDKWVALKQHFEANRAEFPVQQLAPYVGQVVAWEPDGSAIRDSAEDYGSLFAKIRNRGDDPSWYTYEAIPALG